VFGGVLAGSGGDGGVGDVVAIGTSEREESWVALDGGRWRRGAGARNKAKAKGKRNAKMAKAHGDAGRIQSSKVHVVGASARFQA
jgi:hypothetical protein